MLSIPKSIGGMARLIGPHYVIKKVVSSEYFIQYCLAIVSSTIIEVKVRGPIVRQKVTKNNCRLVEPLEVGVVAATPCVAVCFLLNHRWLLKERDLLAILTFRIYLICK